VDFKFGKTAQALPLRVALCIVLSCMVPTNFCAQQADNTAVATSSGAARYPETPDGLKHFVEEGLATDTPSDDYLARLEIPDHASWFAQVFGPAEGARLEAKYQQLLPRMPDELRQNLQFVVRFQRIEVETNGSLQFDPLITAALAAMKEHVKMYGAKVVALQPKDPAAPLRARAQWLTSFVYVNGGYRYLSGGVLAALSTAPDLQFHAGGNINSPALLQRVEPVYPLAAKAADVQGTVVLRVIIAKDGAPRSISVVSGDPLLIDAAVDAVWQWRYRQSQLNNIPIEVESIATVKFSLN
jgi:TonB family protein